MMHLLMLALACDDLGNCVINITPSLVSFARVLYWHSKIRQSQKTQKSSRDLYWTTPVAALHQDPLVAVKP